ncbi:4'-phosphopantetheinyl transferase superfamily protein [Clostridium sp. E02]|uniref:4'-phosphopantetheinyl transferase family protein n=1 Tax=Clostridium sp. E02 TaxID=2487134 RepID=UPI000F53ABBA|nr:4'-phosphopantetheinyl transferase superfamily protein [Clostridium sp. E02]
MVWIYLKKYDDLQVKVKQKRDREHQLGTELLLQGLEEQYGMKKPIEPPLSIAKGECGKPYLTDYPHIHYNISHTDGLVVCAIGDDPLGVDVEKIRTHPQEVIRKIMSEQEKQALNQCLEKERDQLFFQIWTLKESYVKAEGCGITVPLAGISFDLSHDSIVCNKPGVWLEQRILEDRYVLSFCSFKYTELTFVRA